MRNWHLEDLISQNDQFHLRYITYEELTQSNPLLFCISSMRDTLPMRNWHTLRYPKLWISLVNARYITYEELTLNPVNKVLKIYLWDTLPMRNWHGFYYLCVILIVVRDTLPMRNWHILIIIPPLFIKRDTLPMRNWHESWSFHLLMQFPMHHL